jgi:hypothetical protein
MEACMLLPLSSQGQARALRAVVGVVYLACAVMIVYALLKFVALILPRYGHRFSYMLLLLGGVACWTAFRGVRLLFGRTGERVRKA